MPALRIPDSKLDRSGAVPSQDHAASPPIGLVRRQAHHGPAGRHSGWSFVCYTTRGDYRAGAMKRGASTETINFSESYLTESQKGVR